MLGGSLKLELRLRGHDLPQQLAESGLGGQQFLTKGSLSPQWPVCRILGTGFTKSSDLDGGS